MADRHPKETKDRKIDDRNMTDRIRGRDRTFHFSVINLSVLILWFRPQAGLGYIGV